MSIHDPIADMLTRIRNSQAVGEKKLQLPASKMKLSILHVLKKEGYIHDFELQTTGNKKNIAIMLKYYQNSPVIEKINRISCPGLRVYRRSDALPIVRAGMGIAIVSTSQGVMTARDARAQKLGGEVLCTVE